MRAAKIRREVPGQISELLSFRGVSRAGNADFAKRKEILHNNDVQSIDGRLTKKIIMILASGANCLLAPLEVPKRSSKNGL